jgi:hypothetical protein
VKPDTTATEIVADPVPEPWRDEFTVLDEDWSEHHYRHRASAGGVRETYYSAGYRTGATAESADLLSACKAYVEVNDHNGEHDCQGFCDTAIAMWATANRLALTAIARAEGQAS